MSTAGWRLLLLAFLPLAASAQMPSQSGFISIDCGLGGNSSYTDALTGISYTWDGAYVAGGVNRRVSPAVNLSGISPYYANVRSFPDGVRNCYVLRPLVSGRKYLIRADFLYGNYDGLNRPPSFDVYVGVDLMSSVAAAEFSRVEVIAVAGGGEVDVCLVNTGGGTPFVSTLQVRPLLDSMYPLANKSQSLLLLGSRQNYGWPSQIRYPEDANDRMWFPGDGRLPWKPINTTSEVKTMAKDEFQVPSAVLKTAVEATALNESLTLNVGKLPDEETILLLHFAEVKQLATNETREFIVYAGGDLASGPFRPKYLLAETISFNIPPGGSTVICSMKATANSTLPPAFNAVEVYAVKHLLMKSTDEGDVEALSEIKKLLRLGRNWVGDPCFPRNFTWEGLECMANATNYARIISLNLSHSGLSGVIPPLLLNLTALQSLDLSYNKFTGLVPSFLEKLPLLRFLNLESNNLIGPLPPILYEKYRNGSLTLSIRNNPVLCNAERICETTERKRNIVTPVAIAAAVAVALGIVISIIACKMRRRDFNLFRSKIKGLGGKRNENGGLDQESNKFSLSDIKRMTNNFEKEIGKGGFGMVYLGRLEDETQVAVKVLSTTSAQGEKEFRAEAQLLTRVHHRNLVSLLGFCNDIQALVYEFLSKGSLADILSGRNGDNDGLCWRERLRIAIEAAQGLDYLHSGCKPPIVHRDVKTSNILLNENLEAKLADFGLSRAFGKEDMTHISTAVAGTPGYLDPEYYQSFRLNEKSDVYSFGIVLLELLTGEKAICKSLNEEKIHIVQMVSSALERGDITSIADQRMRGQYNVNSLWRAVEIAMACLAPESKRRPAMSEVVVLLKECMSIEESMATSTFSDAIGTDNLMLSICPR